MPKSRILKPFHSKRLLLCTDLSPLAGEALPLALDVLDKGGKLLLFHAFHPVLVPTYAGPDAVVPIYDRKATQALMKQATAKLQQTAKSLGKQNVEVKLVESQQAAKAIAAEAKRFKADLVCLTTHGRGAFQRMLFGSVALKLLAVYRGRVLLLRPKHGR